jgi:predicted Zn finger-like uncharacterized protein
LTIEVQCTSCHTRYRIDEQVLPAGTPTFKCSRCGHVFTLEPRGSDSAEDRGATAAPEAPVATEARGRRESRPTDREAPAGENPSAAAQSGWTAESSIAEGGSASAENNDIAPQETESGEPSAPAAQSESGEKKPATDELFSKPFRDEESSPGDNLRFDFNEIRQDPAMPVAADEVSDDPHSGDWQVGDSDAEATGTAQAHAAAHAPMTEGAKAEPEAPSRARRGSAARTKKSAKAMTEEFVDEDAAPIYNRSVATHTARFFVAMLVLVAFGYGALTIAIRSAPAAAGQMLSSLPRIGDRFIPPITPARLVAMRDVHSDYLRTKGGHTALVVTGIAENVGGKSLHAVQIAASLRDGGEHRLASRAVYCGNNLSATTAAQMTPRELDFFQRLDPPKGFELEPSSSSPFVIVFVDPPDSVRGFEVSVASAGALAAAPDSGDGG